MLHSATHWKPNLEAKYSVSHNEQPPHNQVHCSFSCHSHYPQMLQLVLQTIHSQGTHVINLTDMKDLIDHIQYVTF